MASNADIPNMSMLRQIVLDLAPFPGRAGTTWRTAAICTLAVTIAMMFQIPESAISCYLIIFLMKADGSENTIIPIAAAFAITLLVAMIVPILQWSVESPLLRLLVMTGVSIVFLFIGAASKLGEAGGIVALIIAFVLSLVNQVPIGGVISTGLRYAWEMAIMPMIVMAAFNLCFGRSTVSLLREGMRQRLVAARDVVLANSQDAQERVRELLHQGNDEANKRIMFVRLLHLTSRDALRQIEVDVLASYQLLLAARALPAEISDATRAVLGAEISAAIDALDAGNAMPQPQAMREGSSATERGIHHALATMAGNVEADFAAAPKDTFFAPDALTNPRYQGFALKTTLAAMLCYVFYAGINWQGIHTAMITCYVASLGTAGETIHKLCLRIGGCLIGAALGISSIMFLMPHMDSIGHLMLLLFAVTCIAAWVSSGDERIAYAGVQIGLAFYLTILQGFAPTIDTDTARDRIIGILVGNLAIYFVSTMIWPVTVESSIRTSLSKALKGLAVLASTRPDKRGAMVAQVADIETQLDAVSRNFQLMSFEPKALQPAKTIGNNLQEIAEQVASLDKEIYFSQEDLSYLSLPLTRLAEKVTASDACGTDVPEASPESHTMSLERMEQLIAGKEA
ncbi:FUSC family protein [Pseudochelatococcus sp. G4_1912]|uniref:FUSC family protein n=1 Tax=Pseudochelatococcus sp. G4_1912 TaxID=3114288 RepID=UPI0039C74761